MSRFRAVSAILLWTISCLLLSTPAQAGTAEGILRDSHIFGDAPNLSILATMTIDSGSGTSVRGIEVYVAREERVSVRMLAQVRHPAFLRNMKFLMHRNEDGRTDFWMRTSHGVRRLTGGNRDERLFGSDFTVEDFSYIDPSEYRLTLGPSEDAEKYVIDGELRTPAPDHHAKVFFVNRATGLIDRVEYVDSNGTIVKVYELLSTQLTSGRTFPHEALMSDLVAGTSTRLTIDSVDTAAAIPPRLFNPGAL